MAERSTEKPPRGVLYVVATPIGNLEDITLRALRVLREVDMIACEDTRHTQKLLNHYEIKNKLVSYHEHNELKRSAELVSQMERGLRVALVSDAGTPLISDPGGHLVAAAIAARIDVVPIPGASAFATTIAAAGVAAESVWFLGFLPSRGAERRKRLRAIAAMSWNNDVAAPALIFYEAPHRIHEMLADCAELLGERQTLVARELTKIHEQFLRGTLGELAAKTTDLPARGEFTILIAPRVSAADGSQADDATESPLSLAERVNAIALRQNVSQKDALKLAARELGIPRREAYKRLLEEKR